MGKMCYISVVNTKTFTKSNTTQQVENFMEKNITVQDKKKQIIDAIQPTDEHLTSRAGLALFAQYLQIIRLMPIIERMFGSMRKNKKGIAVSDFFAQILCFFMDGSSRHISWFDHLKRDEGYAALLSCSEQDLASSHAVKRFFGKFSFVRVYLFRHLLQILFIWRLKKTCPTVIVLGLDSMVLDNDDAMKRHGVQPTYKKVKGFHPLQMNWGRYMVDAVFRGGSKHSNHGKTVQEMLVHIVKKIRREYRDDVPIMVRMDAAFFDEKIFETCERLNIGYLCGGKSYANVRNADELANRALKNFGHQQLPFKNFISNTAWYYLMLLGNNLFEAFKEDVSKPVIAVTMYADTFRRQFLDTAGKLVRHAGKLILKIPKTTFERLQLDQLFATCQQALAPI